MRCLGYVPDVAKGPADAPDYCFEGVVHELSPVAGDVSARHFIVDVLDQGKLNTCVPCAVLQAVRASHVRQGAEAPELGSRLFSYYAARVSDAQRDGGAQLRDMFAGLNKFGFCLESVWPYVESAVLDTPSAAAFMAAYDQRRAPGSAGPAYYSRISSTGDERVADVILAIGNGRPVVFGVPVSRSFVDELFDPDEPLLSPAAHETAGSHAMLLTGFCEGTFEVLNSWGTSFGRNGYCMFSPQYVQAASDLWIVDHSII